MIIGACLQHRHAPLQKMANKIITFFVLLYSSLELTGMPADKKFHKFKQTDGTEITLCKVGDEHFHYFSSLDGYPVLSSQNGDFCYAIPNNGILACTNELAHNPGHRSTHEMLFLQSYTSATFRELTMMHDLPLNSFEQSSKLKATNITQTFLSQTKYKGNKKGIVILVNFSNKSFVEQYDNAFYNRFFNEHGFSSDNHIGSVRDYFYDQSNGLFDVQFDVVGPITLSSHYEFYGQNMFKFRTDLHPGVMVTEACNAIDEFVDFNKYDWDNDGNIETVFVVYAGYGENASPDENTIWPHKSSLSSRATIGDGIGPLVLDGVKIDNYACVSELASYSGNDFNGIGTTCHEFSHCLGLPDLYDTDYSGSFGMNKWDVMDAGSYSGPNGRGEIPYGYSAFERAYVGWLKFEKLENESWYALQPLNEFAHAYILNNDAYENEFFIFENHQPYKWYSYVGNYTNLHGMMITHVDYDEKAWTNNAVNGSQTHMRESIVPADNNYGKYNSSNKSYYLSESDYQGDLYPGKNNINRFSSKSFENCGGKLFNQNIDGSYYLNMTIDNITEDNGIISFSVGNNLRTPKNLTASQNGDKLNLSWDEVTDADKYIIEVSRVISFLPSKIENEIIEDIVGTSCSLDYLACIQCSVRVKAKNEFVTSEWSEFVKSTNDTDGINDIENDYSNHREYYNINGTEAIMPKTKSIYIQKENNQTKKIYIR